MIPLRVPVDATPVMYLSQDWVLGVFHTKIIGALTLMGPNWWLKNSLEQVFETKTFGLASSSPRKRSSQIVASAHKISISLVGY